MPDAKGTLDFSEMQCERHELRNLRAPGLFPGAAPDQKAAGLSEPLSL